MDKNSNNYVVIFAVAVCVICSATLAFTFTSLDPSIKANQAYDIQKNVLKACGLWDPVAEADKSRAELEALYHSASIFVLATHYEGYGMALAEALARGLPVLSTHGGAVPDTVPPEAGVLVPSGDEQALTAGLWWFLSGPDAAARRAGLAEGSLRHGRSLPTWGDAALAFERAVQELSPDG